MTERFKYICVPFALKYSNISSENNNNLGLSLNHLHGSLILVCNRDNSVLLGKSELYVNNNCRQSKCKSTYEKASSCIHYWFSAMFFSRLMFRKYDLQWGFDESYSLDVIKFYRSQKRLILVVLSNFKTVTLKLPQNWIGSRELMEDAHVRSL